MEMTPEFNGFMNIMYIYFIKNWDTELPAATMVEKHSTLITSC
jgi:hypothetical protein